MVSGLLIHGFFNLHSCQIKLAILHVTRSNEGNQHTGTTVSPQNYIYITYAIRQLSGSVLDGTIVERILQSIQSSDLLHPAGISASLYKSGQQCDFPMGWAPSQHMIVEALSNSCSKVAWTLAEDIGKRWISTNYAAYNASAEMYEKYDVEGCGKIGTSGIYKPKIGFVWSNGVVLALLEEFGWPSDREIECQH